MKKVLFQTGLSLATFATLAVLLFSCANPAAGTGVVTSTSAKSLSSVEEIVSGSGDYSISGTVFRDIDADGVKDPDEVGISGVALSLSNGAKTVSSSDGSYAFAQLPAGTYTVTMGKLDGYYPIPYYSTDPTDTKTRTISASVTGVDFGLSYESISGFAFRDNDADGVRDPGEEGLAGATLTLSGVASNSAVSDSDGSYLFDHLKGGIASYTVTASSLAGEYHTPYSNSTTAWTGNASSSQVNFGFSHESIAGVVSYDINQNGVRDPEEPGIPGLTLRLSGGPYTISGPDGSYLFDNLKGAATYTVSADNRVGFVQIAASSQTLTPAGSVPAIANFCFALDPAWLDGKSANTNTVEYWKNSLEKAIQNKDHDKLATKSALLGYVATLSNFALDPLNVSTLDEAYDYLRGKNSVYDKSLAKQLMAAEFNYLSGAYLGDNALATYFFVYQGENMLANPGLFSSKQLHDQRKIYEDYNKGRGDDDGGDQPPIT
jgi:hypothetical protein